MSPVFDYKARDQTGTFVEGTIEARTKNSAVDQLKDRGYYLTKIKQQSQGIKLQELLNKWRRVGLRDLNIFCRQFATMINSGLSLVRSLSILEEQTSNSKLQSAISSIREEVEKGKSLSEALEEYDDIFPRLFISMVKAGEAGGILDNTLEEMADHFEREREIQQKVTSALVYPAVISLLSINVVFFLVTFILPTFVEMFKDFSIKLPLTTRVLLKLSQFMNNYWYLVLALIVILVLLIKYYYQTGQGRRKIDGLLLKVPIIGDVIIKLSIGRFSRTLGVLLASGVSILEGLEVISKLVSNQVITDKILEARQSISQGQSIILPLEKSNLFPQMFVQMIKIGEETGTLDQMLERVANFYDQEIEHTLERVVSFIEPAMLLILGLVVGGIVTAVMLPLFNMIQGV
ncbi:type II secretion system F family protein [Halanaerobaculum tunisiense]